MSAAVNLPLWLALPVLIFILLVPGRITLAVCLAYRVPAGQPAVSGLIGGERAFWTLALGVMEAGWLSLLLAELGWFSAGAVALGLAGWSLAGGLWLWRRGYKDHLWRPGLKAVGLDGWLLAALVVGSAILFYLAPHETLAGAQDSGVYISAGASIARTGSILIDDPLLRAVGQAVNDPLAGPKVIPQVLQGVAKKEDRFLFARHLRLPGFFVRDNDQGLYSGQVVPQFFHLYPAYLALGFGLLGVSGMLWVTPLFGVLAVWAVYLTAWRLFPRRQARWIAPLAGLFLALNSIQVWFARESLWEMLGQFLVFTGLYAFLLTLKPDEADAPESGMAGVGLLGGVGLGAAFGLVCLAHAQFPFLVWPLVPYLIYMRLTRRWSAPQWAALVISGCLLLHTVVHIRLFSLPYFEGIYHHVIIEIRSKLHILLPLVSVALFGLLLLDAMPERLRRFELSVLKGWRWVAGSLALLTLLYLGYNYFIRVYDISTDGQGNYPARFWSLSSYIGAPTTEGPERSLVRLGWYFSPLGMLLIIAGLAWLVWRRLDRRTGFFLALLAGITLLFLDTNYTQEQYIYSLRRYLVVTVPAFSIVMAYAVARMLPEVAGLAGRLSIRRGQGRKVFYAGTPGGGQLALALAPPPGPPALAPVESSQLVGDGGRGYRVGRLLGLGLALGLVVFMAWTGRTIYGLAQYGAGEGHPGLARQMADLAARFGPQDVLLFAGDRDPDAKLATPLTYIFGRPSFVLTQSLKNDELSKLIERWESQGYRVRALLGPNGGRFSPPGYELAFVSDFSVRLRQLEELATQKPNNIQVNSLGYAIYDLRRAGGSSSFAASAGQGRVDAPGGWNLTVGQNDYAALVQGFYGVEKERDGRTTYRWTEEGAIIRVPCLSPEGASGRLSIRLAGGPRPATKPAPEVAVYMSNYRYSDETGKRQLLGTARLQAGAQTYTFDLPAGAAPLSCARSETGGPVNSLFLWLVPGPNSSFVPAVEGDSLDPRRLSFKVYEALLTSR